MLFKTIAELKTYIPTLNQNTAWATMRPMVEHAERKYIVQLISQAQYDALNSGYNAAPQTLTAHQLALLPYVQKALTYYAFFEALPMLGAMVSDMGITEQTSNEGTASPTRQWVFNQLRDNVISTADYAADALLSFLEINHANYPLWKASTAYTITKELYLTSVADFEAHIPLGGSKRVWLNIRPFVSLCEIEYIVPAISQKLHDDLKAKILLTPGTALSAAYAKLLPKIQRTLAWLALYKALPFQAVQFTPGVGITSVSTADGHTAKTAADRIRYETAVTAATSSGMSFLRDLKKYLDDHADDYPNYEFNDYENDPQPSYELHDNRDKRSFMV
jgi:hypothetical protein